MMLELIIDSTLNGVLYGMLLFLLASGLTLIFSLMGILNFAHASFYMLGAFLGYQISKVSGFWLGIFIAPAVVALVGAVIERYGLRHLHRHGHVPELLYTFGLAYIIEEIVQMVWGKLPVDYRVPQQLDHPAFALYGLNYPAYKLFILVVAVTIFLAIVAVMRWTRTGLIIQAALSHSDMVSALGHNVSTVFMLVFGAGAGLAALAGVIAGPALVTQSSMAAPLVAILFVVVIVGGLGSLVGALVASLVIALLQTFAVAFNVSVSDAISTTGIGALLDITLPTDLATLTIAQIAPMLPYILLVLVLLIKPAGFLGSRES